MTDTLPPRRDVSLSARRRYQFDVRGLVPATLPPMLGGVTVDGGLTTTMLTGIVEDQAHLHRVLAAISAAGLSLVSLLQLPEEEGGSA